jgi:hypothetical protein
MNVYVESNFVLKVFGRQTRLLGNLRKKPWSDFFTIVKRKRIVGPAGAHQPPMSTLLPTDIPSDAEEGSQ